MSSDGPLVELDRWQLTGVLFMVALLTTAAFFIGRATSAPEPTAAPLPDAPSLQRATATTANTAARHTALAEVWPSTGGIDRALAQASTPPLPTDPTERARAEAHLQLQEARSVGLRGEAAPAPGAAVPMVAPAADGGPTTGYTLQVSLFGSQEAAQAMATTLAQQGHDVRLREVRGGDGQSLFRVELGAFETTAQATTFQRRFERESGYSCVLVPR